MGNDICPTTATFTGRALISPMGNGGDVTYEFSSNDDDVLCNVVCKSFSIAEFVTRCSGTVGIDDVPRTVPPRYCSTDEVHLDGSKLRTLSVKESGTLKWYFSHPKFLNSVWESPTAHAPLLS
mgnify:FL=1